MPNELQRLLPRHYKIIELALEGWSTKDIAQEMDMTPQGIGLIISSPRFQDELSRRRENQEKTADDIHTHTIVQAKDHLEANALKAAETQVGLLSSNSDNIRLTSAQQILDRVLEKKESQKPTVVINADTIQMLQQVLVESGGGPL